MATSAKRVVANLVASWSRKAQSNRPFSAAASQAAKEAIAPAATTRATVADLGNDEILHLLKSGAMSPHRLEADLMDPTRAMVIRRQFVVDQLNRAGSATKVTGKASEAMAKLPAANFDVDAFYNSIVNTNCEAVIGYVPLPVGVVGPLPLDGRHFFVPMATTEGALIASTNRGCAAIRRAGGASTVVTADGMTRAPLVRLPSMMEAARLKAWVEDPVNFQTLAAAFASTSRFGRVKSIQVALAGRNAYLRFKCFTGDAMGMNMITKGVNEALQLLAKQFPEMHVLSLSGNFCTDKKPSAVNWIEGRGKTVAAEVRLSGHVLKTVLKTTADAMVELNTAKNLVGSALAGSIGGFNAHASNILTAVYLATGQDPAQNVESSTCLTLMEKDVTLVDPVHDPEGLAGPGLIMTVNMPSVEVGTVGGGTSLPAQAAALELMGLRGSSSERPGANAEQLARVVAGAVLAGELSLMSALTTNDLLNSHMKLNRKPGSSSSADGHAVAPGALALTESMLAKLKDFTPAAASSSAAGVRYTTVYQPASGGPGAATTKSSGGANHHVAGASTYQLSGSVLGGAPAGAHPHPLSVASAAPASPLAASSPGRRYFAAPTTRSSARYAGAKLNLPAGSLLAAAASGANAFQPSKASAMVDSFEADEPCLPVP